MRPCCRLIWTIWRYRSRISSIVEPISAVSETICSTHISIKHWVKWEVIETHRGTQSTRQSSTMTLTSCSIDLVPSGKAWCLMPPDRAWTMQEPINPCISWQGKWIICARLKPWWLQAREYPLPREDFHLFRNRISTVCSKWVQITIKANCPLALVCLTIRLTTKSSLRVSILDKQLTT